MVYKILSICLILIFTVSVQVSGGIKEIYITCSQADLDNIYENYSEDIYIPVSVAYQDNTWTNARMRIRGDSSRDKAKKSLKMKFDSDPFVNGWSVINFNAEFSDKSYLHQHLSAGLYRETGHPCFESEHAALYVNGSFFGIYLIVENIDDDFLSKWELDTGSNLYKATKDGACLSIYDDVDFHWEKKTNESTGREDLQALIDTINSVRDDEFYSLLRGIMDYDMFINLVTMNLLLQNASTYYHNYYMFHDKQSDKWLIFPWDMDKTFSAYYPYYMYYSTSGTWAPDNPLIERAVTCDEVIDDIKARIEHLRASIFNNENLDPVIDSLRAELEPYIPLDTIDVIESVEEWRQQLELEKEVILKIPDLVLEQFEKQPGNFRLERIGENVQTGDIEFRWTQSVDPRGNPITYDLYISKKINFPEGETELIEDIDENHYVVSSLPEEGRYFWKVIASNGSRTTMGFDSYNFFYYHEGSYLPCRISNDTTLTKDYSPYIIDCDFVMDFGTTLTLKEGVAVLIKGDYNITINGGIRVEGTEQEPVSFLPFDSESTWGWLSIDKPDRDCIFNNVIVENAKIGLKKEERDNIRVIFDNLVYTNRNMYLEKDNAVVIGMKSDAIFRNCTFNGNGTGDGVFLQFSSPLVENCLFYNLPDAIEYNGADGGIIRNNEVYNSNDDGIDLNGCIGTLIYGNKIFNSADKGLSIGYDWVGKSENIIIERNIIVGCSVGIQVKNSSNAFITNNTLYGNRIGVECYEKTEGYGGGIADIKNTIIAHCTETNIKLDQLSTATVSYSLSNTILFDGVGNRKKTPGFTDPEANDFSLLVTSPCIDTGDPDSPDDPDGSRADIGAIPFDKGTPRVVINEICYNSADDFYSGDWVEFYNAGETGVDISGWEFKDSDDTHIFEFPQGTILDSDKYIVLCRADSLFSELYPEVENYIGNFDFGLSGGGELIRLFNAAGELVDYVEYDDNAPWPTDADGNGPTLELINSDLDNALAESWKASLQDHGTPGRRNSVYIPTSVRDGSFTNGAIKAYCYPNPCTDKTVIEFNIEQPKNVLITLGDIVGRTGSVILDEHKQAGPHRLELDLGDYPSGIYILRWLIGKQVFYTKIIKI